MRRSPLLAAWCHPASPAICDGLCAACLRRREAPPREPARPPGPIGRPRKTERVQEMRRGPPSEDPRAVYMREWRARKRAKNPRELSTEPAAVYARAWRASHRKVYPAANVNEAAATPLPYSTLSGPIGE